MISTKMTEYCLGFYFNKSREEVILIGKRKPPWQAGKFNGVGGKIELNKLGESEGPWVAMLREFEEETGVKTKMDNWKLKITMGGLDWTCYVFAGFHDSDEFPPFRDFQDHEEIAQVVELKELGFDGSFAEHVIPNLHWLIPLCLDKDVASVSATYY